MPKVLVVEDNKDARRLMKSILTLDHLDVVVARDGVEGLQQAGSEMPDLIVTDISMPRLSGGEMIRKLRASPTHKNVPILDITAHGMERAMEAIKAGASRALARPVENHLFLVFVHDLLNIQRPTSGRSSGCA